MDARHRGKVNGGYMGLVLTRTTSESIMIGDDVEIKIIGNTGGVVRYLITAPKNISIHRKEVWERIQAGETWDKKT